MATKRKKDIPPEINLPKPPKEESTQGTQGEKVT